MSKIIKTTPAPYPPTASSELDAVTCLLDILDKKLVKPDIKVLDKFPNIDGSIELTNLDQIPIGEFNVQVKTVSQNKDETISYQCTLPFLAYCENSILPVILITVDIESHIAYWIHISQSVLVDLANKKKEGAASVALNIPKINCISKDAKQYIIEWSKICEIYRNRIINYAPIESNLNELKKVNEELSRIATTKLGEDLPIYKEIHIFLDHLNRLLENEFSIVKDIVYSGLWKIGFAFSEYEDLRVKFILYAIKYTAQANEAHIEMQRTSDYFKDGINFKGINHQLISASHTGPDFIYEYLPMQFYLYKLIKERLTTFFERKIK